MNFETTLELPVRVEIVSATKGSPGYFNPRDGGSPPEPPEVELRVLLGTQDITASLDDDTLSALTDQAIEHLENSEG
jgi:hypothetical protein